ncbi:hypothetical protein ASG67_17970 [Sphingomonas sp. Leaf339]|nr:PEPxxWA-CTERM sorting domain-containing protein [Sphingomonas sp. Leaf339]KQU53523.1 hypothetical protein ASG67_17970 [Sphingomonas sp. Leaf339]
MKTKIFALALVASAVITGSANAATRTFTISDGMFTDGGTFGGSFAFNGSAYQYTNVKIFSKGGIFGDYDYSDRDIDYGFANELVLDAPGQRFFNINFLNSLLGAENPSFRSSIRGYELNSANDDRRIKSGLLSVAAVPEPATWAMMLVGFGMIGATTRYRRKSTAIRYA